MMNYSTNNNTQLSYVNSPTKLKEIPAALFPIMSTGFNSYVSYPSPDNLSNYANSILLPQCSPPPVPKFNVDSTKPLSLSSFDKLEESDSNQETKQESNVIANNCSLSHLKTDFLDSTSGREDWTEDMGMDVMNDHDRGSQSTHLFAASNNADKISKMSSASSNNENDKFGFDFIGNLDTIITVCLGIMSFSSPILMIVLPNIRIFGWPSISCSTTCESYLVFICCKLFILSIASLVLFCRRKTYSFPRVLVFKLFLIVLLFTIIFSLWLFYVLRILLTSNMKSDSDFDSIVSFSSNVTDILMFTHYLSLVVLEIRHLETKFCIKVVRSPDGESRFYQMGNISIQAAAVRILQIYVLDFPMYNVYARSTYKSSISRDSNTDLYGSRNKDSHMNQNEVQNQERNSHSSSKKSVKSPRQSPRSSKGDKFPRSVTQYEIGSISLREKLYKEIEHEKRIKKRRLRLMASTEDAFSRIKRLSDFEDNKHWNKNDTSIKILTNVEAAQNILAQLAKPFQKYLRLARLQMQFPKSRIHNHLVKCLQYGMSAQAFLESFISTPKVMETSELINGQIWTIFCKVTLSRGLSNKLTFMLKRENVSLMCSVYHIPMFSLSEYTMDHDSQKFLIKFNSETSV